MRSTSGKLPDKILSHEFNHLRFKEPAKNFTMDDCWAKALALKFTVEDNVKAKKALATIGDKFKFRHRHREKIVDFVTSTSLCSDLVFTITHAGLMSHFYLHPHLLLGICLTNANSFVNKFHTRKDIFSETVLNNIDEVMLSTTQGCEISMRPYYKESILQNFVSAGIFAYNSAIVIQGFRRLTYNKATEYPKKFFQRPELSQKFWPYKSLPLFHPIPGAPARAFTCGCVVAMAFLFDFGTRTAKTISNAHQFKEIILREIDQA